MDTENTSEEYKIISLDIARKGARGYVGKIVENALSKGIKTFKIRKGGSSDSAFPNMCVPVAALIDHYTKTCGCTFTLAHSAKNTYLAHTQFVSPRKYQGEDVYKANFLDCVWRYDVTDNNLIVDGIIHSLRGCGQFAQGVIESIELCLNEVMDNVINHSLPKNVPVEKAVGYVMVQYHQENNAVSFAVHDNGQGILKSFEGSKFAPESDSAAIKLALKKEITSGNGAGRGMWMLFRLLENNYGYLCITSGSTKYSIQHRSDEKPKISEALIQSQVDGTTTVDFRIDGSQEIDVAEALDGYTPVDLWRENHEDENDEGAYRFNVRDESQGTGTRYAAKKMRNLILNTYVQDPKRILLDFGSCGVVTSSYADELLGKLVQEIGFTRFLSDFTLLNVSPFNELIINEALLTFFKNLSQNSQSGEIA